MTAHRPIPRLDTSLSRIATSLRGAMVCRTTAWLGACRATGWLGSKRSEAPRPSSFGNSVRLTRSTFPFLIAIGIASASYVRAEDSAPTPATSPNDVARAIDEAITQLDRLETTASPAVRPANDAAQTAAANSLGEVVRLLEQLPQQQPQPSPSPSSSSSSGSSGGRDQPSWRSSSRENSSDRSTSQPASSPLRRNGQDSDQQLQPASQIRDANAAATDGAPPELAIWGHLPERVRQQLLNSAQSRRLPRYEQQIDRFYESLGSSKRKTSRASK